MKKREKGFSLVELMIVLAIIVILSLIAIPQIQLVVANYRLNAAGHAAASLLQQARLQAVKTNQPAYVQYNASQSPNMIFVNADPTVTSYATGNPDVELSSAVSFQAVAAGGPPDHSQLDAYLGVPAKGASGVTVELGTAIGFNARGFPCMESSVGEPTLCPQQDATTPSTLPVFEWFMQGSSNGGWEAVTVTAAGRIKSWRLSQQDPTGKICGYAACWQ